MSYPTDGRKFEVEGKIYRWKPYKTNYKCPYGQLGRFQVMVWNGDFFKWKKDYDLVPGKEWHYVD